MKRIALVLASMLMGCTHYLNAAVKISPPANQPGNVVVTLENRGKSDELLDSTALTVEPGKTATGMFKVKAGTTLVTLLRFPGGAHARETRDVPTQHGQQPWPVSLELPSVDIVDEAASEEWLRESAAKLSLDDEDGRSIATPYSEVAKYIGALTIAPKDVNPKEFSVAKVIYAVPVFEPKPPAPTEASTLKNRVELKYNANANSSLNVPVYGSLTGALTAGRFYRFAFDLVHYRMIGMDNGVLEALLAKDNPKADAALGALRLLASRNPDAQVLVLRTVRYIKSGTVGITEGKDFKSELSTAVASVFSTTAGYSFNVNEEQYVGMSSMVTAWVWVRLDSNLGEFMVKINEARGKIDGLPIPTDVNKDFPRSPISAK